MTSEYSLPISLTSQEGVRADQTVDLTNIVKLLKKDSYRPASELSLYGDVLCPDKKWRHIIGHDTTIDRGVDVSYGLEQNIIVDFESDEVLRRIYPYAVDTINVSVPDDVQLRGFVEIVRKFLPYDESRVMQFLRSRRDLEDGDFQNLGDFVQMGIKDGRIVGGGVCLHQALLAGLFLERMITEGKIKGVVGVFRNHDIDAGSAHAWAVYNNGDSTYIIDPANDIITSVEDQSGWKWRYGLIES